MHERYESKLSLKLDKTKFQLIYQHYIEFI